MWVFFTSTIISRGDDMSVKVHLPCCSQSRPAVARSAHNTQQSQISGRTEHADSGKGQFDTRSPSPPVPQHLCAPTDGVMDGRIDSDLQPAAPRLSLQPEGILPERTFRLPTARRGSHAII